MKKLIPLLLGLILGALGYHFFVDSSTPSARKSKTMEMKDLKIEAYKDFLSNQFAKSSYDSNKGKFITVKMVKDRQKAFEKWVDTSRVHNDVFIPSSFFVGKDSLKTLLARAEEANGAAPNGPDKVAGFVIQFTLVEDTFTQTDENGNEVSTQMNRLDPVLIPARVNKKLIIRGPNGLLEGGMEGTLLDESLPCPDQCPVDWYE